MRKKACFFSINLNLNIIFFIISHALKTAIYTYTHVPNISMCKEIEYKLLSLKKISYLNEDLI